MQPRKRDYARAVTRGELFFIDRPRPLLTLGFRGRPSAGLAPAPRIKGGRGRANRLSPHPRCPTAGSSSAPVLAVRPDIRFRLGAKPQVCDAERQGDSRGLLNGATSYVWIVLALDMPIGRVGEPKLDDTPVFPLELGCQPHAHPTLGRIAIVVELKIKNRIEVMNSAKTRRP